MSLKQRLFLLVAFVAVLSLGAVPSEAQGRRGGRVRSVVVVGRGYYWADPFWYGYGYPFAPYYQYPIGAYPYRLLPLRPWQRHSGRGHPEGS